MKTLYSNGSVVTDGKWTNYIKWKYIRNMTKVLHLQEIKQLLNEKKEKNNSCKKRYIC